MEPDTKKYNLSDLLQESVILLEHEDASHHPQGLKILDNVLSVLDKTDNNITICFNPKRMDMEVF